MATVQELKDWGEVPLRDVVVLSIYKAQHRILRQKLKRINLNGKEFCSSDTDIGHFKAVPQKQGAT